MIPLHDDVRTRRVPALTAALVAANLAAFAWQLRAGLARSIEIGGAIPYELLTSTDIGPRDLLPPPLTVLTSMFLHAGPWHLGGNLLFLWIFGRRVEGALGHLRFAALYLGAGIAAALAQAIATASGAAGLAPGPAAAALSTPMVGASGAIAGLLAAYLLLFPRARIGTAFLVFILVRVVDVPAAIFIGGWFLLQVATAFLGGAPGVAVFAHVGGFVAGLAGALLLRRRGPSPPRRAR